MDIRFLINPVKNLVVVFPVGRPIRWLEVWDVATID